MQVNNYNLLEWNTIYNCTEEGLDIWKSLYNITITYNNIFNNTLFGLAFNDAENCTVKWNNFVDNNNGGVQGYDNEVTNTISNNYWDDYIGDGTQPYFLDGGTSNDTSPSVTPVLPKVTIISPIGQEYSIDTITINLYGTPRIFQYLYYIAGIDGNNQTWTTNVGRTLSDGTYTLHAYGIDFLGNTGHDSVTFTIDADLPTIVIDSPSAMTYATGTITVVLSGDAEHFWYYIASIDSVNQSWTTAIQRSLDDDTYTLHAYSNDSAGNEAYTSVTFSIDTTSLTVVIDSPGPWIYATDTITIDLSGDAIHYWYYIEGEDSQNQTWTNSVNRTLVDGTYTLHAFGNDTVGNIAHDTVTFELDTIAPIVNITSPTNTTYDINPN